MAMLTSIQLDDPSVSEAEANDIKEKASLYLSTFDQIHIGKPNSGTGQNRTVILARQGTQWVQVLKVWGKSKSQTYSYAVKLVFDARRIQEEVKSQTRSITERRYEIRQKAVNERKLARQKANQIRYTPRHQA